MPSEKLVLLLFAIFFAAEFIIERVLAVLNARYVEKHRAAIPPPLSGLVTPENYARTAEYTLAKARFGHVQAAIGAALTLTILFSGLLPWLQRQVLALGYGELTSGVLLLGAFTVINMLLQLPLTAYSTFGLEARFGFNKTTPKTFILDRVKGLVISAVLGAPFLYALLAFMTRSGPLWWLWAALFVVAFQLVMMVLYPLVISPLFNKFTPLQEGELKTRLEALARHTNFALQGIFVMDGSKRSAHSNAYFTGLGKARRVVLFDTLVNQMSVPELAGVLAHEIGHYKLGHIPKMLVLMSALILASFYALSLLLNWPPLYAAFGLGEPNAAMGLLLFSLIAGVFTFWLGPFMNALSRKHEYEADAYAAEQTQDAPSMASALLKLHKENLSNLTPHPAFSAWHYSHPTLLERLAALDK